MKKLDFKRMEVLENGLVPSPHQVTCFAVTTIIGIFNAGGGFVIGAICLFS